MGHPFPGELGVVYNILHGEITIGSMVGLESEHSEPSGRISVSESLGAGECDMFTNEDVDTRECNFELGTRWMLVYV